MSVYPIGRLDKNIYNCITKDIVVDEVVITENQMKHIHERHPDTFENLIRDIKEAIDSPDYIIKDKHKNTGLVIKKQNDKEQNIHIVLRICTSEDEPGYKNSVISSWNISERRLQNYLRNKQILYKKE